MSLQFCWCHYKAAE